MDKTKAVQGVHKTDEFKSVSTTEFWVMGIMCFALLIGAIVALTKAQKAPKTGATKSQPQPISGPKSYKNRTLAIVLALFLGGLGIHKFYLERPGVGILYLLFCWTFIPALISLFEGLGYLFTSEDAWDSTVNAHALTKKAA